MAYGATIKYKLIGIFLAALFVIGCSSGNGNNLDANGQPVAGTPPDAGCALMKPGLSLLSSM